MQSLTHCGILLEGDREAEADIFIPRLLQNSRGMMLKFIPRLLQNSLGMMPMKQQPQ